MAITVTVTLNRSYEASMGNKRQTGGTFVISGTFDASTTLVANNTLGLKQVEYFSAEGGSLNSSPLIEVQGINNSGVTLAFLGASTASEIGGLHLLSTGTAISNVFQWRGTGY